MKQIIEARIEEIGSGKKKDLLLISNRKRNLWIFSLFNGYRQIGTFYIKKPHSFKEGEDIFVTLEDDKIMSVTGKSITIDAS